MTIEDMISSTGDFETKKFPKSLDVKPDSDPRFFEVDVADEYRYALRWIDAPKSRFQPQPQSVLGERIPLSSCDSYTFEYGGDVDLIPDVMRVGQVFVVSSAMKSVIQSIDPDGAEFMDAEVLNAPDWSCSAFLSARSLWAVDAALNDIVIDKKGLGNVPFPQVSHSRKFVFNKSIPSEVHLFSDLGSPTMYWSRELLDLCQISGLRGIFAWAGYSDSTVAYLLN